MPKDLFMEMGNTSPEEKRQPVDLFEKFGIKQRKDIISRGFTPEELVNWAESESHPLLRNLKRMGVMAHLGGKEMITIPAHYFNQLFLNFPRSIAHAFNIEYPEKAENKLVNLTAKGAGAVGMFTSPLLNALSTLGKGKKILEAPLRYKALAGAVTGAAYAPSENVIGLKERAGQAITGGILGLTAPLAIKGTGKIIQGIKKGTEYIAKSAVDYVTTKVAPRAYKMYQNAVQNFTPEIQKFAKEKLKIPPSAINTIKQKGIEYINTIRQKYNDSVDLISQKISSGIQEMRNKADDAYNQAINNFKGNTINSQKFYQTIQKGLREKGWIDLQGNPTSRYKSGLNPVIDKLTDLYMDMRPGITTKGKKITGQIINKEDFSTYRDALSAMLRDKPSDILVQQARNALYDSAESSGMKGLKAARNLEAKAFIFEKRFLDSQGNIKALGREGSLARFHKLSQEQIRQLKEIENYIGKSFIDDLSSLTAGQYLDDFNKITPEGMAEELQNFIHPARTPLGYNKYKELLGEKNAKEIFKDIVAHRRGVKLKRGALAGLGIATIGGGIKSGMRLLKRNE